MKILDFPLLCRQIGEGAILGQVIGLDRQLVASDVRSLAGDFSAHLEKQLREGEYHEPEILKPRLKTFKIAVQPHYRDKQRLYPVKETIEVPIHAVYGSHEDNCFECFLPLLGKSFYFYAERDLDKLVEHFAKDSLHDMPPGQIYGLLHASTPWLESVTVKVPRAEPRRHAPEDFSHLTTLTSVAERLPYPRKASGQPGVDAAWERGDLVEKLMAMLDLEGSHVLLVGSAGVGKSTILREAIRRLHQQQKARDREERRSYWRTTPARITAKAKYLGEWQENCEELVSDLAQARGLLWVENFVMLALTGGEGPEDSVAAFITPFLRQKQMQLVSEATPEQVDAMRRLLPGFVENFRLVRVNELDTPATLRLIGYFASHAEKHQRVAFTQPALEMSYVLLERFVRYERFPGKAVRFLSSCVSKAQVEQLTTLDNSEIIQQFSVQTGLPAFLLRDDVPLDDHALRAHFQARIMGQDHVIDKIASVVKVFKAGLNDPNKPVATMIFAGPTGVGKTATAKALADYFFSTGQTSQPLIRLDMSEFQHPSQVYRLIGAQGKLVQFVREKPFCVVLLDEIEKAHPQIFDALLALLDEGILLDSAGRLTDFRNAIMLMTTNLGTAQRSSLGFRNYQPVDFEASIKSFFRPEFFNRIDATVSFNSLDETTVRAITRSELATLDARDGIRNRGIRLTFTNNLVDYLVEKSFDSRYGARPLQREIERLLVAPLARLMLQTPALANCLLTVDYDGQEVTFHQP